MTILVDLDDTMVDLLGPWTANLNKKYFLNVKKDDVGEWDMRAAYPTLQEEQIYTPLLEEELWATVKPIDGAVEYIQKLMQQGHEIVVVTATHYDNVGMKMKNVLLKYFPFIPYENVIVAARKQRISGDILIDDGYHNLIGGKYQGILFDAPYNRNFLCRKYGVRRARSWREVYQIINEWNMR